MSVDQVGADVGNKVLKFVPILTIVSVDQVGADVGNDSYSRYSISSCYRVRRSGWCRRRQQRNNPHSKTRNRVSVDQVGADVGNLEQEFKVPIEFTCPSIRLVPT